MGSRIRELRKFHKLTQQQLGDMCNAGKSAVSQWENNETTPTLANILALQERLRFSIDWLVSDAGESPGGDLRTHRLMELYGQLDERGRAAVFRVAEAESAYTIPAKHLPRRSA